MNRFIAKQGDKIIGVLKSWDRMLFRGTLLNLVRAQMLYLYLNVLHVPNTRWGRHLQAMSDLVETRSLQTARDLDVEIRYVHRNDGRKDDLIRKIVQERRITEGPIVVLSAMEPCKSFRVVPSKRTSGVFLREIRTQCKHLYFYRMDPTFGLMHVRLQTWFPFSLQVCLNGHHWLARGMDQVGLRYEAHDNRFLWIENFARAQKLADSFLHTSWQPELDRFAMEVNPALPEVLGPFRSSYYWSLWQSEFSTDLAFDPQFDLEGMTRALARYGLLHFESDDVMRFLGRKLTGHFQGKIVSHLKGRTEGIRLRHDAGHNSIKLYNEANVLRMETTINDTHDFKVFRRKQGDRRGKKARRILRQGVTDMRERAKISDRCNDRYLDALVDADTTSPLGKVFETVTSPRTYKRKRVRALRPWSPEDFRLIQAVSRPEFCLNGFRNADLHPLLFGTSPVSPENRRRRVAQVTRLIRLLRAHRLVRKVSHTRRYKLTQKGRTTLTTILHAHGVTLEELQRVA